jgi:hypothetical protein
MIMFTFAQSTDAGAQDDTVTDDLFQGNNDDLRILTVLRSTHEQALGSAFGPICFTKQLSRRLRPSCLVEPVASGSVPNQVLSTESSSASFA